MILAASRSALRFNPRPLLLTGESLPVGAAGITAAGFNPRPLLLTGESCLALSATPSCSCFNPRPLLLTGESGDGDFQRCNERVSIHARYC